MNLTPTTLKMLKGPSWSGYWIGRFQALRDNWMMKARHVDDRSVKDIYVRYAREYNRELIGAKKKLSEEGATS